MVYFPKETFSNILEYCDDRVEQKQRYLWSKIKPGRFIAYEPSTSFFGEEYISCDYVFYDELSGEAFDRMGWWVYSHQPILSPTHLTNFGNDDLSILDIRWDDCESEGWGDCVCEDYYKNIK